MLNWTCLDKYCAENLSKYAIGGLNDEINDVMDEDLICIRNCPSLSPCVFLVYISQKRTQQNSNLLATLQIIESFSRSSWLMRFIVATVRLK